MSEMNHTAEPWNAVMGVDRRWRIHSEKVSHIVEVNEPGEADAIRIVACVNACAGIPTEVLSAPDYSIRAELDTLDEQIARRLNAEDERNRLYALRIKNEEELHSLRFRLAAIEQAATDVEAYIDGERLAVPDVYMERLRDELIRTRNALGILPEQDTVWLKKDHDVPCPREQHKPIPSLYCRCNIHPVPEGPKPVLEIVADYLMANGYDGLCCEECGCGVEHIAPCGNIGLDCVPARKTVCTECGDCDHGKRGEPCYSPVKEEQDVKNN